MLGFILKVGILCVCLCLSSWTQTAVAQTFEEGYQAYMRNQFPVAELQFKEALKTAKTKEDKAFILKFIGICQFMRGDRKLSAASFYQAVQFDRSLTIDEEEVLEPSVVAFFQSVKSRVPNEVPAPKGASVPAESSAAQTQTPQPPAAAGPKLVKPTKKKFVKKDSIESTGSGSTSSDFSWWYLLPFGAGQFANQNYLLGSAVAGGHVFFLYRTLTLQKKIVDQQDLLSETLASPAYTDVEKNEFQVLSSDYIEQIRKDKGLAQAGFVGLWLVSGVQAYFAGRSIAKETNPTSPAASPTTESSAVLWEPMYLPSNRGGTFVMRWTAAIP